MFNKLINWIVKKSNGRVDREELVLGLVLGLVWGLAWSFGSLLSVNLIAVFHTQPNWIALGILLLVITEILFWFDSKKPTKKENQLTFTAKRKGIAALWGIGIITQVVGGFQTYKEVSPLVIQQFQEILKWIGYIGAGLLIVVGVVLLVYMYLWANSRKYSK